MLLRNRQYGWARGFFQKNVIRWKSWKPQTPDTERRWRQAAAPSPNATAAWRSESQSHTCSPRSSRPTLSSRILKNACGQRSLTIARAATYLKKVEPAFRAARVSKRSFAKDLLARANAIRCWSSSPNAACSGRQAPKSWTNGPPPSRPAVPRNSANPRVRRRRISRPRLLPAPQIRVRFSTSPPKLPKFRATIDTWVASESTSGSGRPASSKRARWPPAPVSSAESKPTA